MIRPNGGTTRHAIPLLFATALLLSAGREAHPQQPATQPGLPATEGAVIGSIRVVGLVQVEERYLLSLLRSRVGEPYSAATVTADVDRLFRTGKFDDIGSSATTQDGKVAIVFSVAERSVISSIEITGNRRYKLKDLLPVTELVEGAPISEYTIKRARDGLERKYKEAGYYYVTVTVDEAALRNEGKVALAISEGPRVRVRDVLFEGNAAFRRFTLYNQVETKSYIYILRKGDLDDERLQRDTASLTTYYKDRGYLDAQVGYEVSFAANGADATVKFTIREGPLYRIRKLDFMGATIFQTAEFMHPDVMRLRPGEALVDERLKADLKHIQQLYWRAGYIFADVRADWVYADEPALVDLTISIEERSQFHMGRVIIQGNKRTQDKVVRRELNFLPGETYNRDGTEQSEQRLKELRLFSEAKITPIGEDPAVRDALVEVTEGDTTSLIFGVGVTSNNGLVGSVTSEQRNFDLFDWPRDWNEFFRGRAFHGAGQTLRIAAEPGTEVSRFRLDFREPYLFDRNLGFNQAFYLFQRGYTEYKERRIGFNTSFDHRFRHGPLRNWAAEIAFRAENVKINGLKWYALDEFRDVEGSSWLTSIKGTLVRNTTDSIFLPSRGSRFSVSWEQYGAMGGSYTFAKTLVDYNRFFNVHTDTFDRKHIIGLGGTIGNILGDAPMFERFYAGGLGSVRGFDFRGISPRDGPLGSHFFFSNQRLGGDFLFLMNAEYSFPLVGTSLRGVTFVDMGTVEQNVQITEWRSAAGLGARIYIPFFGPIPLSFDFAWPITRESKDDTRVFSFAFGTTF